MADALETGENGVVIGCRHGGVALQPGIDLLVGGFEQRFEIIEFRLAEAGQVRFRERSEDQIDLLEAAALGAEK